MRSRSGQISLARDDLVECETRVGIPHFGSWYSGCAGVGDQQAKYRKSCLRKILNNLGRQAQVPRPFWLGGDPDYSVFDNFDLHH